MKEASQLAVVLVVLLGLLWVAMPILVLRVVLEIRKTNRTLATVVKWLEFWERERRRARGEISEKNPKKFVKSR
jgi:hypothetical protein